MPNQIIDELIEEQIDIFCNAFTQRAKVLFRDDEKHNNIRHPGEFGTYREGIVRDFIRSFLPQHLAIDTGFIVNALGDVSGQIDLVVYDATLTPPLESKNRQRFFPIETVVAAGEVKSDVRRDEFKDALIRLAKVKKMRSNLHDETSDVKRWHGLFYTKYNPDIIAYDQVFTFLLCNKIVFPLRDAFPSILHGIYKTVSHEHRHSSILSIEDGIIHYITEYHTGEILDCFFPVSPIGKGPNKNKWHHRDTDVYTYFKLFCSSLFEHAAHATVGSVVLSKYVHYGKSHYLVER